MTDEIEIPSWDEFDLDEWSPAVKAKAATLRPTLMTHDGTVHTWQVEGEHGVYAVSTDGRLWGVCTCTNGTKLARPRCSHLHAAILATQRVALPDQ